MNAESSLLRVFFWLLVGFPLISLMLALESLWSAHSADEAFGGVILSAPLFLLILLLAPVVIARAYGSNELSRRQREIVTALGCSVIPLYFLVSAIWWWLGWNYAANRSTCGAIGTVIALLAWNFGLWAARRSLRNGSPTPGSS